MPRSRGTWGIAPDALREAKDTLGIRLPVAIRNTSSLESHTILGLYSFDPDARVHLIQIDPRLSRRHANRILWHELAHAAQGERLKRRQVVGLGGYDERRPPLISSPSFRRYWKEPYEREARGVERRYARHVDIAVRIK